MAAIIFENKVRFVPYFIDEKKSMTDIIHTLYDPEIFDYEVYPLNAYRTDMDMFNALKNSNILDTSGYFYLLKGFCSMDYNERKMKESIVSILNVFDNYYMFPKKSDKISNYTPLEPEYTRTNTSVELIKDLRPLMRTCPPPENDLEVNGFSFQSRNIDNKYQQINAYNKHNLITYIIYQNTEEDTIIYLSKQSIDPYKNKLVEVFPELKELGDIHVLGENDIKSIIHSHLDKTAIELWNIIQTECNVLFPPDIPPSRERINSTIHKIYKLNTERKESIPYKNILERLITELYGEKIIPKPTVLKLIKRTLPSILKECGLDKKRMAGGFHWYGMKEKNNKNETSKIPIDTLFEMMEKEREKSIITE